MNWGYGYEVRLGGCVMGVRGIVVPWYGGGGESWAVLFGVCCGIPFEGLRGW